MSSLYFSNVIIRKCRVRAGFSVADSARCEIEILESDDQYKQIAILRAFKRSNYTS